MKEILPLDNSFMALISKYLGCSYETILEHSFLKIDHTNHFILGPGLGDQQWQLQVYIKIAYFCNLVLELPLRQLCPGHNNGKTVTLDWNEYLSIEDSRINGESLSVYVTNKIEEEELRKTLCIKPLNDENGRIALTEFDQYFLSNENYRVDLQFSLPHWAISQVNKLLLKYPDQFKSIIHIRRGDRVVNVGHIERNLSVEQYDKATSAKNILKKLNDLNCTNKDIYVMTDMLEGDPVIEELNLSKFNFTFYYDYQELITLKEQNNYKLYLIETELHKRATFKVYSEFWLNKNLWH